MVKDLIERKVVLLVITTGAVQKESKYQYHYPGASVKYATGFCGGPETDEKKTRKALLDLQENGIDWNKTTQVDRDSSSAFNGTDQDPLRVYYHYCDVCSNSGNEYRFAIEFELSNLSQMFKNMDEIMNTEWASQLDDNSQQI